MAAVGGIQDEATCPLCLNHFTDPVTIIECGPNLCQSCRTRYWEELENAPDVPSPDLESPKGLLQLLLEGGTDQQRNLVPNGYLKNMFEIVKKLCLWGQGKVERVCEMHKEPLKLFCKVHQIPICLMCQGSKEHQSHQVLPLEEAFQEYKDQIDRRLKNLTADKEKIMTYKADAEKESQHLLNQAEEERQNAKADFRQIRQFLEEQEKSLLDQIDAVEKEITRRRDDHLAILSWELSSLENNIQEVKEKCQQPVTEFLQDVRRTLERSEKKIVFENPVVFPRVLTRKIRKFRDVKPFLENVMKQFPAVGVPAKLPLLYTAGTSQVISGTRGAPNGQQPAITPGPGPIDCFGTCSSIAGPMAQPVFDSSTAQVPFGGSNSLASFHTRSTTDQPVFGETASTFKTTTTSAVSGVGATTQTTSSNAGSIFGSSTPFQFTFRWPHQPTPADLSAGRGSSRGIVAPSSFGLSPTQLLLGSQKQDSIFSVSNPGTTPESKTAFGGVPTSTIGQGSPASGWSTAGNPPSGGVPVTSASGGSGSTFEFKTPTFCIGKDFEKGSMSRHRQRLQFARHRLLQAYRM